MELGQQPQIESSHSSVPIASAIPPFIANVSRMVLQWLINCPLYGRSLIFLDSPSECHLLIFETVLDIIRYWAYKTLLQGRLLARSRVNVNKLQMAGLAGIALGVTVSRAHQAKPFIGSIQI